MARDTAFETHAEMSKDDVTVRSQLAQEEERKLALPGYRNNPALRVENRERPRRGHGY